MAAELVWRKIVRGESVMCWERRRERDGFLPRAVPFGPKITRRCVLFYSVDVNRKAAVDVDAALGYRKRLLSHVLLWVKKVGDHIPNEWAVVDIVGDIVTNLIKNLAVEHDGRLDMGAFYYTFMDPPLVGRGYLHGEIRL
ncbi:hypothetical protein CBR_g38892 [Chara braunii]|uniref:Uncharacterized protein n=1 Tax=Chara braunii TaxID=69332 RepID=A0A388LQS0_CHABU|nr:hypothetical protein CBR_g38892 [Chara braunii]|eukprot:GBG84609.1 hypothetical protein CBR_g38892 [Chara braunii]